MNTNKPLTVKELAHQLLALIDAWWWWMHVVITSDDEINSVHWLWNWIVTFKVDELKDIDWNDDIPELWINYANCVLLW